VNQPQSSDMMIQTSKTNQDTHMKLLEKTSLQPKPQLAHPSTLIAPGSILQMMPIPHLPSNDMSIGMLSQPLLNVLSSDNTLMPFSSGMDTTSTTPHTSNSFGIDLLNIINPTSWLSGPDPMVGLRFDEDMGSSLMNGKFMSLLSNPTGEP